MSPTTTAANPPVDLSKVRLVASDLDGTLIVGSFNGGNLTQRTIDVLHALEKKGIRIVFASGRPTRTMIPAVEQAGLSNLMVICCNGAQVVDSHTKTIVKKFSIPAHHVQEIVTKVKAALGDEAFIGVECDAQFKCEQGYADKRRPFMNHAHVIVEDPRTDFFQTEEDTVEKIIIVHKTWPADQLNAYLLEHVFSEKSWMDVIYPTFSSMHFVEISAAGVSKATAIQYLCEKLDVAKEEVIAFGDMPNDIEMIKFAGIGVAMGNAHAKVQELADMVTVNNVDDGVAVVLEKMLAQL
ncbi:HAD-like domain-containing protein [Zychaea mexicana]|uniref:HAD-like domain-containing protein n=1 Tax=Zychaea mexicana TaxID=64656 RepID=UPI0022FEF571|nr:HAD-like domain-containing protein [Zychaea mexicana]KAI9488021.1 HAD-like domain-containing protein [Zychaea mexicana]